MKTVGATQPKKVYLTPIELQGPRVQGQLTMQ